MPLFFLQPSCFLAQCKDEIHEMVLDKLVQVHCRIQHEDTHAGWLLYSDAVPRWIVLLGFGCKSVGHGVGADCRLALSYPCEANAKKSNMIFWFIRQSVSSRDEDAHHQFVSYWGHPLRNAACYSGAMKFCRQDPGVKIKWSLRQQNELGWSANQ